MMTTYYELEIRKFISKGVIIDTNLYVLLLVGRTNIEKVGTDKRTRKYVKEDYILLENIINRFDKRFTIPNVITETSNLIGSGRKVTVPGVNSALADDVALLEEENFTSFTCTSDPAFLRFGVTDVAIKLISEKNKILVLTDDFPLFNYLSRTKLPVLNFNHFRDI